MARTGDEYGFLVGRTPLPEVVLLETTGTGTGSGGGGEAFALNATQVREMQRRIATTRHGSEFVHAVQESGDDFLFYAPASASVDYADTPVPSTGVLPHSQNAAAVAGNDPRRIQSASSAARVHSSNNGGGGGGGGRGPGGTMHSQYKDNNVKQAKYPLYL